MNLSELAMMTDMQIINEINIPISTPGRLNNEPEIIGIIIIIINNKIFLKLNIGVYNNNQ